MADQSLWMFWPERSPADRQQFGKLVTGCCRVARLSGEAGHVGQHIQGTGVLGAEHLNADRKQLSVLLEGVLRIAGFASHPREVAADGERVRVFGSGHALAD